MKWLEWKPKVQLITRLIMVVLAMFMALTFLSVNTYAADGEGTAPHTIKFYFHTFQIAHSPRNAFYKLEFDGREVARYENGTDVVAAESGRSHSVFSHVSWFRTDAAIGEPVTEGNESLSTNYALKDGDNFYLNPQASSDFFTEELWGAGNVPSGWEQIDVIYYLQQGDEYVPQPISENADMANDGDTAYLGKRAFHTIVEAPKCKITLPDGIGMKYSDTSEIFPSEEITGDKFKYTTDGDNRCKLILYATDSKRKPVDLNCDVDFTVLTEKDDNTWELALDFWYEGADITVTGSTERILAEDESLITYDINGASAGEGWMNEDVVKTYSATAVDADRFSKLTGPDGAEFDGLLVDGKAYAPGDQIKIKDKKVTAKILWKDYGNTNVNYATYNQDYDDDMSTHGDAWKDSDRIKNGWTTVKAPSEDAVTPDKMEYFAGIRIGDDFYSVGDSYYPLDGQTIVYTYGYINQPNSAEVSEGEAATFQASSSMEDRQWFANLRTDWTPSEFKSWGEDHGQYYASDYMTPGTMTIGRTEAVDAEYNYVTSQGSTFTVKTNNTKITGLLIDKDGIITAAKSTEPAEGQDSCEMTFDIIYEGPYTLQLYAANIDAQQEEPVIESITFKKNAESEPLTLKLDKNATPINTPSIVKTNDGGWKFRAVTSYTSFSAPDYSTALVGEELRLSKGEKITLNADVSKADANIQPVLILRSKNGSRSVRSDENLTATAPASGSYVPIIIANGYGMDAEYVSMKLRNISLSIPVGSTDTNLNVSSSENSKFYKDGTEFYYTGVQHIKIDGNTYEYNVKSDLARLTINKQEAEKHLLKIYLDSPKIGDVMEENWPRLELDGEDLGKIKASWEKTTAAYGETIIYRSPGEDYDEGNVQSANGYSGNNDRAQEGDNIVLIPTLINQERIDISETNGELKWRDVDVEYIVDGVVQDISKNENVDQLGYKLPNFAYHIILEKPQYAITLPQGAVALNEQEEQVDLAKAGEEITVRASSEDDYLDNCLSADVELQKEAVGLYTFTMPDKMVSITGMVQTRPDVLFNIPTSDVLCKASDEKLTLSNLYSVKDPSKINGNETELVCLNLTGEYTRTFRTYGDLKTGTIDVKRTLALYEVHLTYDGKEYISDQFIVAPVYDPSNPGKDYKAVTIHVDGNGGQVNNGNPTLSPDLGSRITYDNWASYVTQAPYGMEFNGVSIKGYHANTYVDYSENQSYQVVHDSDKSSDPSRHVIVRYNWKPAAGYSTLTLDPNGGHLAYSNWSNQIVMSADDSYQFLMYDLNNYIRYSGGTNELLGFQVGDKEYFDGDEIQITEDCTAKAIWAETEELTVTYDANGGITGDDWIDSEEIGNDFLRVEAPESDFVQAPEGKAFVGYEITRGDKIFQVSVGDKFYPHDGDAIKFLWISTEGPFTQNIMVGDAAVYHANVEGAADGQWYAATPVKAIDAAKISGTKYDTDAINAVLNMYQNYLLSLGEIEIDSDGCYMVKAGDEHYDVLNALVLEPVDLEEGDVVRYDIKMDVLKGQVTPVLVLVDQYGDTWYPDEPMTVEIEEDGEYTPIILFTGTEVQNTDTEEWEPAEAKIHQVYTSLPIDGADSPELTVSPSENAQYYQTLNGFYWIGYGSIGSAKTLVKTGIGELGILDPEKNDLESVARSINNLPALDEITLESEEQIQNVRYGYDHLLTDKQKEENPTLALKLVQAEKKLAEVKLAKAEADKAVAEQARKEAEKLTAQAVTDKQQAEADKARAIADMNLAIVAKNQAEADRDLAIAAQKQAEQAARDAEAAEQKARDLATQANTDKETAENAQREAEALRAAAIEAQKIAESKQDIAEQAQKNAEDKLAAAEQALKEVEAAAAKAAAIAKQQKTFAASKPAISSLKALKGKKIKVAWKATSGVYRYQIRYSKKKSMSGAKTINVKASGKSRTISKLKAKKKYYVQIRVQKKIGGKLISSQWSGKKSVKARK